MGADITLHIEKRAGGAWVHVGEPDIMRDYSAFAALGLTSRADPEDGPPIVESRDLPTDASAATVTGFDGGEHRFGPSWLTLAELAPHRDRLGPCFRDALAVMAVSGPPEDVRAVFWFTS